MNYVSPYWEENFSPMAETPTATYQRTVTAGISSGHSSGFYAVGTVSTGVIEGYGKSAISTSTKKSGAQRLISYNFSSNSKKSEKGFQKLVNEYCKNSYKALYAFTYSRNASPLHSETGRRIVNRSSYWVVGENGIAESTASFSAAMY